MKNKTINGRIMAEPYKGQRKIESQVKSGFASVKQKSTVVALKVLADAHIGDQIVTTGSFVHVLEEVLFHKLTTQKPFESKDVEGEFVFIDFNDVLFISENK